MNNIDSMPPKCHDCPYCEMCEYPYVCPEETKTYNNHRERRDNMNSYDYCVAAKNAIIKVAKEKYGEDYTIEDIQVVWMVHLLGFKKGIYIDNGQNQRIYEVTYNRDKNEMYVDAYEKQSNTVIFDYQIDTVAHVVRRSFYDSKRVN